MKSGPLNIISCRLINVVEKIGYQKLTETIYSEPFL